MLIAVAGSRPYDAFSLLDEPLWRVLYLYHHLSEREAERVLVRRSDRVDAGLLAAMAFHEPTLLTDEQRAVRHALEALADDPDPVAEDKGQALLARVLRGRALDPDALVS